MLCKLLPTLISAPLPRLPSIILMEFISVPYEMRFATFFISHSSSSFRFKSTTHQVHIYEYCSLMVLSFFLLFFQSAYLKQEATVNYTNNHKKKKTFLCVSQKKISFRLLLLMMRRMKIFEANLNKIIILCAKKEKKLFVWQ